MDMFTMNNVTVNLDKNDNRAKECPHCQNTKSKDLYYCKSCKIIFCGNCAPSGWSLRCPICSEAMPARKIGEIY